MARNEEKALSMLSRFHAMKEAEDKAPQKKRPKFTSECKDLGEAEKWRLQVLRAIGRNVQEIQNGTLGEHKIRDLNDEINKSLREKFHWEKRILELGGPDYSKQAKVIESDGREVKGSKGYLYFGAAKSLPGVKELLEAEEAIQKKRTRAQIYQSIDADYYGYRDEDDGILLDVEEKSTEQAIESAVEAWKQSRTTSSAPASDHPSSNPDLDFVDADRISITNVNGNGSSDNENLNSGSSEISPFAVSILSLQSPPPAFQSALPSIGVGNVNSGKSTIVSSSSSSLSTSSNTDSSISKSDSNSGGGEFSMHVPIPNQEDIEARLLERRKQELLKKYAVVGKVL